MDEGDGEWEEEATGPDMGDVDFRWQWSFLKGTVTAQCQETKEYFKPSLILDFYYMYSGKNYVSVLLSWLTKYQNVKKKPC